MTNQETDRVTGYGPFNPVLGWVVGLMEGREQRRAERRRRTVWKRADELGRRLVDREGAYIQFSREWNANGKQNEAAIEEWSKKWRGTPEWLILQTENRLVSRLRGEQSVAASVTEQVEIDTMSPEVALVALGRWLNQREDRAALGVNVDFEELIGWQFETLLSERATEEVASTVVGTWFGDEVVPIGRLAGGIGINVVFRCDTSGSTARRWVYGFELVEM